MQNFLTDLMLGKIKIDMQEYKVGHSYTINGSQVYIGSSLPLDKTEIKKLNFNYKQTETMENKKYVAPFDDHNGVKKGDILTIKNDRFYENNCGFIYSRNIVETFFEEYKEPKKLITMDDIVVGKTVLVKDDSECLVVDKTKKYIYSSRDYYSIEHINKNFTIRQI